MKIRAMTLAELARLASLCVILALAAGCGGRNVKSADDLNASYERALAATAAAAVELEAGSAEAQAALQRLETYFAEMTGTSVRDQTQTVYAPTAYLNDNLVYIEGAANIEAYFLHSTGDTDTVSVEFLDVAKSGADYFVRWRMTIRNQRLKKGEPLMSYGMTHFRFDDQGRVLMHKDFWDAATGLYEYLPVVGGMVRYVRGRLEQHGGGDES